MSQHPSDNLNFDIKRSIILAEYIKCWGIPESRNTISIPQNTTKIQHADAVDNKKTFVELYVFPGEDMDQVTRIATIGLSSCKFNNDKYSNSELLMVLPFDVVEDQLALIQHYMANILNYIMTLGRTIKSEEIISENQFIGSESVPLGWPRALLFDEPRGEPNELNYFHIGSQHITLSWLVPIFDSEYDLIKSNGIEAFDIAVNEAEVSLVEVRRDACV